MCVCRRQVAVICHYFFSGRLTVAAVLLCLLVASHLAQAKNALALGQGWAIAAGSVLGLKPIIEGYRKLYNAKRLPGQTVNNGQTLFLTRMIAAATQSGPQSFTQAIALCSTVSGSRSGIQVLSLTISCLVLGYQVAKADREIDAVPRLRDTEPLLYG